MSLSRILPLAGVAMKVGDKIVAALDVDGAPGSEEHKIFQRAGFELQDRVVATKRSH
jgi:hypothetical protein